MRRASSAPSLSSLGGGGGQPEAPAPAHPLLARSKKHSTSSGALSKLAPAARPADGQRESGRLRTRALPLDVHLPAQPPVPQLVPQIAAESARGLIGLECYQLWGAGLDAPALAAPQAPEQPQQPQQQEASKVALASCLATPATGEDRNLGEMVESEARALMKASQERVAVRYETEVRLGQGLVLEEVAAQEERERHASSRRKRRLAGLLRGGSRGKRPAGDPFPPQCAEARRVLEALGSRAGGANRIELPWARFGDVCFPMDPAPDLDLPQAGLPEGQEPRPPLAASGT